jgi:hypothetical protein
VVTGTTSLGDDLRLRWLPTRQAVRHARALLAAEPAADFAVVPLYQPGKQYGIWMLGQVVNTVQGAVFLAVNSSEPTAGVPTLGWAREAACLVAREQLRIDGRGGTVAYAVVRADSVAVFEDFGIEP